MQDFKAEKDIAGIILNRWTYAYRKPAARLLLRQRWKTRTQGRYPQPFGRIAFAHAELNGHQHWVAAADEGRRAARQAMRVL